MAADHDPHHVMSMSSEKVFFTLQGDSQVGKLGRENLDAGTMMTYVSSSNDGSLVFGNKQWF